MPAWKAEAFIEPVLRSLATQTYSNLRILISDDASPDATAAMCEAFAARDPRFEVIRQTRNLGWIGNVNALLRAARGRGEYFFFAFHDDTLEPEYVGALVAELEKNSRAVLAFCDVRITHVNGPEVVSNYDRLEGVADPLERGRRVIRQEGRWWIPHRGVFRSWAAENIGGLKRHLADDFVADWPWMLHMALLGEEIRVPRVLCNKVYHQESRSRQWDYTDFARWAVALSCMREVWNSPLGLSGKLLLLGRLTEFCARIAWRRMREILRNQKTAPPDATRQD